MSVVVDEIMSYIQGYADEAPDEATAQDVLTTVRERLDAMLGSASTLPDSETLVATIVQAAGDEGAQYTLHFPGHPDKLIGDAQDEYGVLAAILDGEYGERYPDPQWWRDPDREFPLEGMDGALYEKCAHCHLMVEDQRPVPEGIAAFIHLTRGDDLDERYEDHEPAPSGMVATLRTWMVYGPDLMRERFHVK